MTTKRQPSIIFQSDELLMHISDAVIATDMDMNVLFFNKAAESIYGIDANKITGCRLSSFIRYIFHGTTAKESFEQLRRDGFWQGKVSFQREDGEIVDLLVNVSFIMDNTGIRTGIVSVNKDVTKLGKIEKKSRQYKLRMKSILNGTKEALFLVDANYQLLVINNQARAFIQKFVGKEVTPGCCFIDIFPVYRHNQIRQSINKALQGQDSEYEVAYSNGLYCLVNYTSVLNEYTEEKEICIAARDITERKKAEEEIRMLSLLAKETENGVMIIDPQSSITWVNEGFTRMNGYSYTDAIGQHPKLLFKGTETDIKTVLQIEKHIKMGKHFSCELASYHKNGSKMWVRLDIQPVFDENKNLIKFFTIQTDLTEQHLQKETELKNKIEQQKEINRVILKTQEEFSNEIGRELHDNINQLLTVAKLQLEIAQSNIDGNQAFIAKGRQSVETAIDEIRTLSRHLISSPCLEVDLLNGINELVEDLRLTEIITLDCKDFNPHQFYPEIKLNLFRIVQEQLKNIIKHAKATAIHIILENNEDQLSLFIEDNGKGFDLRQKKTGIGLINIRNRVDSYDGSLHINTAPGKGCQMLVKLPCKKPG